MQNLKKKLPLYQQVQDLALSILKSEGHSNLEKKLMASLDENNPGLVLAGKFFSIYFNNGMESLAGLLNGDNRLLNDFVKGAMVNLVTQFTVVYKMGYQSCVGNKNFLHALSDNQIAYCHVDEESRGLRKKFAKLFDGLPKSENFVKKLESFGNKLNADEAIKNRDKNMSNFYLNASQAVFGRVGLLHVKGMQKLIAESQSPDEAQRFLFIYPYAGPIIYVEQVHFQNGEVELPLGMSVIDANNENMEVIVERIVQLIEDKIAVMKKHQSNSQILPTSINEKAAPRVLQI